MTTPETVPSPAVERRKAPPRPDQEAYEKSLAEINAQIEILKAKQAEAQSKINGTDNIKGSFDGRRKELRAQLDELMKERNELNDQRTKISDKMTAIQSTLKKRGDEVRNSKDRLGYKSVEEVDQQINALEKQLQTGQAKLIEEKRMVAEISNLRKAKKVIEGFSAQQSSVQDERAKLDELRAQLNALHPQRNAVREKLDAVRAQLNELDNERKSQMGSFNELVNERKSVKAELDAEFDKLRTLRTEFKKQKDEYYAWQQEERKRKQEQYKARKQEEYEMRLTAAAEREREAAEVPAYTDEINECAALIKFLQSDSKTATTSTATSTPAAARSVDNGLPDGAVLLKKKSDREDDYMVMGGKKGGKKGRKQGGAGEEKAKPFKLDLETISQFIKLKVEIPTSAADVPKAVEALEAKKKWFEERQEEQTVKNKAAAEAKIAALKARAAQGENGGTETPSSEVEGTVGAATDEIAP
ncbi:hypothetical protein HK104_011184 [Borealophlyctis nickersoniae]|nr:hypothetical protein HK104_011184 [Borealophlyctis nickersoniae]